MMGGGADAKQGKVSQHSCGSLGTREVVRAGIVGRVMTLRIFPRSSHESHQARDGEQRGLDNTRLLSDSGHRSAEEEEKEPSPPYGANNPGRGPHNQRVKEAHRQSRNRTW